MALPETLVYKVLSAADYAAALELGHSNTALDTADGFVHLSTPRQLRRTLDRYYAGQTGVHLLEFVVERFSCEVRWEDAPSRPEDSPFPHLYGPLLLGAATRHWELDDSNSTLADLAV